MVESTPQVSPGELTGNLGWLLAQASHALSTEMTAAFEAGGATPRGHCVLSTARTGEFTQKELADMVGLDKTTMVVTLDALERAGYAERRVSSTDRRARVVAVTAEGRQVLHRAYGVAGEVIDRVLLDLSEVQRAALVDALEILTQGVLATPSHTAPQRRRRVPSASG